MKHILSLILSLSCCIGTVLAQNYEAQGTTVKRQGCNIIITIQIALDNDSTGDVANIQAALDGCFFLTCDLPCADGKKGRCKIITQALVVSWNSLSDADKPKFHHIVMLSGQGRSEVDAVGVPNGKSIGGRWYRDEYSPKVYCHEVMHLAGLADHYRDCGRLAVNNCKDTIQCTEAQIAAGACPSCPGYEDDLMGSDVNSPVDCNMDIVEVIRVANGLNPVFFCPDSCCEPVHRTVGNEIFIGFSTIFEDSKPNRFNTFGGNIAFMHPVSTSVDLTADAGVYFGSNSGVSYTKAQVLIGASFLPVQYDRNELSFSPHIMAGVSNVTSKFKLGTYSSSTSTTSFSADAGVDVSLPFSKKAGVACRVDYNPTFYSGGVSNNFRLSLGVDWKLIGGKK
jgi:hypothetical protein